MHIILGVAGWTAWVLTAYLAYAWIYGCRNYARAGRPFQWATAMQAFFFSAAAVVFLVGPFNKLHIVWVLPALFVAARVFSVSRIPVIGSVLHLLTVLFVRLALVGIAPPAVQSNDPKP